MINNLTNHWVKTELSEYYVECSDCYSLSKENNEELKCSRHEPEEEEGDVIFDLILSNR